MISAQVRLSILIPVTGPISKMEQGLVSVLENRPERSEIVLVFNGPYADPYELQDEARFVQAAEGASLCEMINVGLRHCRGRIVHLLAAGAEVEAGWTDAALEHFADARVAAVAPVVLDARDRQRVASAGVEYRTSGTRVLRGAGTRATEAGQLGGAVLGPTLGAAFLVRAALELGDDGPLADCVGERLADVELALVMRERGLTAVCEPRSRVVAGVESAAGGAVAHGRAAERLFLRHVPLAGWGTSLALHPLAIVGDGWLRGRFLSAGLRLIGRLTAWGEMGRVRRHHERLAAYKARRQAPHPAVPRPHVRIDAGHGDEAGRRHRAKSDAPRKTPRG